ncbi:MAG: hypothetical protein U9R37_02785 [Campylobacterota bacterium]|nr:hypothetical protein [Campylobacterota bacterium]
MKFMIMVFILASSLIAKECYYTKNEKICYKRYYNKANLDKPKISQKYYYDNYGKVYYFTDKIKVKFKSAAMIFSILNDYEIEFHDKLDNGKYVFTVNNKTELFDLLNILNKSTHIVRADPIKVRKYTLSQLWQIKRDKEKSLENRIEQVKRNSGKPKKTAKELEAEKTKKKMNILDGQAEK